jgi:hypothetical protein
MLFKRLVNWDGPISRKINVEELTGRRLLPGGVPTPKYLR